MSCPMRENCLECISDFIPAQVRSEKLKSARLQPTIFRTGLPHPRNIEDLGPAQPES